MSSNIGDIVLEAMIKEAVIANFEERMAAMPSEEQLRKEYTPSPEHVRKMKKLFAWEKRRDFRRKAMPITKAAAVVLCVATTVLFGILLTSSEVRAAVRGTFVRFFEGFAQVEFSKTPETNDRTADSFRLGFIPHGYELMGSEELFEGIFTIYSDDEGHLLFFEIKNPDSPAFDTDYGEYRTETHNGVVYHVFESRESDYYSSVSWVQYGFMFVLTGVIPVDELLEMALSLE
jgi:hypothetical protein